MGGEWRELRIGDLVEQGSLAVGDGYRMRNEELGPEGIPFVRGGDIGDGWINTNTVDHIRPELAERIAPKLTRPGDAAFITKGTVGRAGRLRTGQPSVVFAPQVAYWRVLDERVLDPGFIYYLMRGPAFQAALDGVKSHGAMVADYVSISQQLDFSFRFPPVSEQKRIAAVLGSFDDKIEINRRMSETLESIARALFESWFVDFDPVRAKAEGRETGLPQALAAYFSGEFLDSEFGEIPKEWTVGTLSDIALCNPESWSRSTRPTTLEYVDLGGVKWGRLEETKTFTGSDAPSRAQRILRHRDTIVGTVRPGNGSFAYILRDGLTASTGFAVLRPRDRRFASFLYCAATSSETISELAHLADGGAYPAVSDKTVAATRVVLPSDALLERFEQTAGVCFERIHSLECESASLRSLRDSLLPRLLSAQIGLPGPFGRSVE